MLASSVAAQAAAPRFGKKATGVSARKAISNVPVGGHRVEVRDARKVSDKKNRADRASRPPPGTRRGRHRAPPRAVASPPAAHRPAGPVRGAIRARRDPDDLPPLSERSFLLVTLDPRAAHRPSLPPSSAPRVSPQAAPKAVAFSVSAAAGKKTAIVTGASSGLGLNTAKSLVDRGDYHVVMAVRNVAKGEEAAKKMGFPADSYTVMECELGDLSSVRAFCKKFRGTKKLSNNFQALICNAAIYYPNAVEPTYTKDGFEETVGVTHLGHFLMANILLQDLVKAQDMGIDKRLCIVGSVTANTNTLAGQVPPRANLGDMSGLEAGLKGDRNAGAMIDGDRFIGPKAYKDAKLCNILTVKEMSNRWHEETGVTFSTMYPGCIADTPLFRNHTPVFRFLFPLIQKYVTKGYVTESEAGGRLASVVSEPQYTESGAYWAWKGGGDQLWDNYWDNDNREEAFNNKTSKEGGDMLKAKEMFDMSAEVVGLKPSEIGPQGGAGIKMPSMPSMPKMPAMGGAK